jgi:hypothetical protein
MNSNFPIYIISKGRWESRFTAKALLKMKQPFRVVVEPKEFKNYASVLPLENLIEAPENFSELKQGSIPVRNFVWDHSAAEGHLKHWILDDNIDGFYRLNRNMKIPVSDATIFRAAEDFTGRYSNVKISGMNYFMFAPRKQKQPPYVLNTRIYSCILIDNSLEHRWRGRYNEDTDLSLRTLKSGYCTILFNAFLCYKMQTMTMKGGNTDTIYNTNDNRRAFAESLQKQHPDCVKVTWKFNRWHHEVDYSFFKRNKLILKPDIVIPKGIDNYGMWLKHLADR